MNSVSLPVLLLSGLGTVIAVLGLFVGGSVPLVIIGLAAIAIAGLLHVSEKRRA